MANQQQPTVKTKRTKYLTADEYFVPGDYVQVSDKRFGKFTQTGCMPADIHTVVCKYMGTSFVEGSATIEHPKTFQKFDLSSLWLDHVTYQGKLIAEGPCYYEA